MEHKKITFSKASWTSLVRVLVSHLTITSSYKSFYLFPHRLSFLKTQLGHYIRSKERSENSTHIDTVPVPPRNGYTCHCPSKAGSIWRAHPYPEARGIHLPLHFLRVRHPHGGMFGRFHYASISPHSYQHCPLHQLDRFPQRCLLLERHSRPRDRSNGHANATSSNCTWSTIVSGRTQLYSCFPHGISLPTVTATHWTRPSWSCFMRLLQHTIHRCCRSLSVPKKIHTLSTITPRFHAILGHSISLPRNEPCLVHFEDSAGGGRLPHDICRGMDHAE